LLRERSGLRVCHPERSEGSLEFALRPPPLLQPLRRAQIATREAASLTRTQTNFRDPLLRMTDQETPALVQPAKNQWGMNLAV